ncbi:hypothetical protein HPB51_000465 [Rhipicephalus microplus]|uniref:Uncharacterized protein n=1 Tax=Rhipicephalus microplus TaxID=6941 RepID=A0A9J6EQK1_RHIMP|nr:hypothetical protein HPB51_000465 [Rhipicephalus microplus]
MKVNKNKNKPFAICVNEWSRSGEPLCRRSVNDAHNVSTTGATTSFQLSPPIQGATPTSKEGSTGADVKVSRDHAKSLFYGDRSPPKVKAWPGTPSGSPSLSSSPGRKGVIMTPPRSPSLSILPDTRDEEVRLLPGFDKIIQEFQRYYSYIQWIVAAREHDQVVKHLSGHLCQVISVTQVEVSAPWDDYRSCEERRVVPAADVGMLAGYRPRAGRFPKNTRVVFANQDDSSRLCYTRGNFITLVRLAYAALNITLVETCNNGETDSLLLDRRVDFVTTIPKLVSMRSYYGRQQRRLMLAIEESGLWLHHITRRFPPCSNGVAMAVFDMPFSDYATVYLVGCVLSLLAFSAEVAYQRCFLARRLQASVPAVVIRHR